MRWFSGSVVEAVNLSKSKNAVFVVYVEGDDDNSKEMTSMINNADVSARLESEKFVSIKIKSGSQDYIQFARLYHIVPVPSMFFIGKSGTPLEVIGAGLDTSKLISKIDLLPSASGVGGVPSSTSLKLSSPSTSRDSYEPPPPDVDFTITGPPSDQHLNEGKKDGSTSNKDDNQGDKRSSVTPPKRQKSEEYEVVCDGDVCVRKPKVLTEPVEDTFLPGKQTIQETSSVSKDVPMDQSNPAEPPKPSPVVQSEVSTQALQLAIEERMRKAQELIEQKRIEKEEKEKEEAKAKEIERRHTGKGVAELKRWQHEQEMKNLQEERKREKMENDQARAKILEQIAQDRAERRSRDPSGNPNVVVKTASPAPVTSTQVSGSEARIQFKLTDGTSKVDKFAASTTLSELREYVRTNLQINAPFALWTMFPRRAFTEEENSSDLSTLGLVPSSVLLVVGEGSVSSSKPSSGPPAAVTGTFANIYNALVQLFWSLFVSPAQFAWSWINGAGSARRGAEKRRADGQPSRPGSDGPSSRPGTSHRRPGDNVRRLRGSTPPPDDNNTWNGNSTQQM